MLCGAGAHSLWDAGALEELLDFCRKSEQGAVGYDHIFGTSAGAISAAYIAQFPSATCHASAAPSLAAIWRTAGSYVLSSGFPVLSWTPFGVVRYALHLMGSALRVLTGRSLIDPSVPSSITQRVLDPIRLS